MTCTYLDLDCDVNAIGEIITIYFGRSFIYSFYKTLMYYRSKKKKKKRNTPTNSNTNYRREMKLVPINKDYCLLSFDVFKFSLGGRLHEGVLTLIFSK